MSKLQQQLPNCKNPDPYMCVIARACSRWGDNKPCPVVDNQPDTTKGEAK